MSKDFKLHNHDVIKAATKAACKASSIKRGVSDVAAAGGIEFELVFQRAINESRGKDFPFLALLKRDLDLNDSIEHLELDWGTLGSREKFLNNQKKSWNDQSNADIIFFKQDGDKWKYYDAWSIKTTVAIDPNKLMGKIKGKGKTTQVLDLVNLKDKQMSEIFKNFKVNQQEEIKAGRCFLTICNNGNYSSYFWDGDVSKICKMMVENKFKVDKDVEKNISFSNNSFKHKLIICSKRSSAGASTSFGRALQISASPTKNRKANFLAEMMVKSKVFEKIVTGKFSCKQALKSSFKNRLNIK